MIFLWLFTCITGIFFFLDINLVVFHFWLIEHNMTTYDFIMKKRDKNTLTRNVQYN